MLRNAILIAIGAGLVSATAFVSAVAGPPAIGALLFVIAALPLYVAGVGWSWAAALLAAAIGAIALSLLGAKDAALLFAGGFGFPAVALTYLSDVRMRVTDGQGQEAASWYPPGFIVIATATFGSAIAVLVTLAMNDQPEVVRNEVQKFVESMPQLAEARKLTPVDSAKVAEYIVALIPTAVALVAMVSALIDLWLAGRIVNASGQLRRPWPDIAAMQFPRGTSFVLAAATLGGMTLPGIAGSVAGSISGAFMIAYLLLGLAVIHFTTRGKPWRPFLLWAVYAGLLIVNIWVAVPIIILGLLEGIYPLRRPPAAPDAT